ncbi:MAG TPA: prenyltransferase [Micromonosporaceae bacterium]|nr:prenyltransferase [Micromonosporaceae bacterium]
MSTAASPPPGAASPPPGAASPPPGAASPPVAARLAAWRHAFRTTNPPEQGVVDQVTRWLVVTRAGVLPMTLTSGLVAVLLAAAGAGAGRVGVDWLNVTLAVAGIVIAHIANNMMNDLADTEVGTDTASYPRALYAPHPILTGLVSKRQLVLGILLANVLDLAIMVTLVARQDWWVATFALGGLFLSWAYTAPPLRLKRVGLGELDVLVTWGPLMVGGVYYAGTGELGWHVVAAATVYALLPTTVLLGKHIDKIPYDAPAGTRTLPVLLGEGRAKALTQAMMVGYHAGVVALVALGALPWPALLTLLAAPMLVRTIREYARPKPAGPPVPTPVWPLWWAPLAFLHTRRAGGLLVLGLAGWAVWALVR